MKTYVTHNDYNGIINSMSGEEIRVKYGVLEKMSRHEYEKKKHTERMKNKLRKEGKYYGD